MIGRNAEKNKQKITFFLFGARAEWVAMRFFAFLWGELPAQQWHTIYTNNGFIWKSSVQIIHGKHTKSGDSLTSSYWSKQDSMPRTPNFGWPRSCSWTSLITLTDYVELVPSVLLPSEFACKGVADVAFIVDSSGSIGRRNWVKMLQFVKDMVKDFNVGPQKTHIAVVAYSNNAKVEFKFNSLKESEITEERYYRLIDRMGFQRGFTFIDKALILTNEEIFSTASGMRPGLPQVWKEY